VTDGLVIVDKPAGLTSHDVVARMRRIARTRKVGHAGTLDPMATGVLVVGVNRATRLLNHLVLADKSYLATIRLGQSSTTDDAEGELTAGAVPDKRLPGLDVAMSALTGDILQVPSSVSAIKVDGERAYKRVRAGESFELAARPVTVSRFERLAARPGDSVLDLDVAVDCSSGTYIRALARDLGIALGVGGHLTALRRTRVGPFAIGDALTLEQLAERDDPITLPLRQAVETAMPVRAVTAAEARELSFGRALEPAGIDGTYGAVDPDGVTIALLADTDGRARPVLVFTPAG
jgi:tRNA pseudouridine55 synthase